MEIRTIYSVDEVVKLLQALGFLVLDYEEADESSDAEVTLTDLVSVQVGEGYLIANRWYNEKEAMLSYPARIHPRELVVDLVQAGVHPSCSI